MPRRDPGLIVTVPGITHDDARRGMRAAEQSLAQQPHIRTARVIHRESEVLLARFDGRRWIETINEALTQHRRRVTTLDEDIAAHERACRECGEMHPASDIAEYDHYSDLGEIAICRECSASQRCPACDGVGRVTGSEPRWTPHGMGRDSWTERCEACDGTGWARA